MLVCFTEQAVRLWDYNLEKEDSPVTELFAGQLQGNIVCHKCKSRFTKSVPTSPLHSGT